MEPTDIKKAIECIIFVSDQPVSVDKLQQVFTELEKGDIRKYLKELVQEWGALGRGILLEEVAGGYQFR
ncbi:MAG: SMC-Scp complex subunit ScpB, partial [Thermodesulfobacteriota bacterium]